MVDDSITMRLFYRSVLEAAGFQIEEAANGLEGYERILTQNFDLVIVDINMPKMDGYTMIRAVRDDPAVRRLPAVFVSTEAGEKDAILAYEAGANFYLVKPVAPDRSDRGCAPDDRHGWPMTTSLLESFVSEARELLQGSAAALLVLEKHPGGRGRDQRGIPLGSHSKRVGGAVRFPRLRQAGPCRRRMF